MEAQDRFRFEFSLELEDFLAMTRESARLRSADADRSKRETAFWLLFLGNLGLSAWFISRTGLSGAGPFEFGNAMIAAAMLGWRYFLQPFIVRRHFLRSGLVGRPHVVTVDSRGIDVAVDARSYAIAWREVQAVSQDAGHVYFWISATQAVILPASAFDGEAASRERLLAHAMERTGDDVR
jgi:hypothetical protein